MVCRRLKTQKGHVEAVYENMVTVEEGNKCDFLEEREKISRHGIGDLEL
jgi:hypothetical protein